MLLFIFDANSISSSIMAPQLLHKDAIGTFIGHLYSYAIAKSTQSRSLAIKSTMRDVGERRIHVSRKVFAGPTFLALDWNCLGSLSCLIIA